MLQLTPFLLLLLFAAIDAPAAAAPDEDKLGKA
jgi:hypothetical protein